MTPPEEPFLLEDPALYGPDPSHEAKRRWHLGSTLGLTPAQCVGILTVSMMIFLFLGGPFWSAPRQGFMARIVASYLIVPLLVEAALRWNRGHTWMNFLFASSVLASVKFAITVVIDVTHGLLRHWPP